MPGKQVKLKLQGLKMSCNQRESISNEDTNSTSVETSSLAINTSASVMNQEYETQFFGFTPKSFSDGMYNAVLELTWDCLDGTRQYITSQFPKYLSVEAAEKAVEAMIPKLTAAIDKAFDKFETYILTNIFVIPPHVVLPEDALHQTDSYTKEFEDQLDAEIKELEDKISAAKYMNSMMRQELQDIVKVQALYDQFLSLQSQMEKACFDMGVADLKESLVFNNEKAVKIQNILQRLKPLNRTDGLNTLPSSENRQPDCGDIKATKS